MFCDLIGSTALAGQLDPEELRDVMHAYRQTCAAVVRRFDGHIAQYLGDGLLVYFGHPRAHEDDAQRAVRAGLATIKAVAAMPSPVGLPQRLQVRVGLHTGIVVVGGSGEGGHEHLAMGEVPNIAARLQSLAGPNAVVLSEATHRLTLGYFVYEDLGPQVLKGRATPMRVYHALAASDIQSRFDLQVSTGLTPLVGREEEVNLLLRRWQAVTAGHGQVMLLSGEAGIGKSRLLQVLRERLGDAAQMSVECRCSAHHSNSALYPVIDHLHRLLRFGREDTSAEKLAKLKSTLSGYRFVESDTLPLFAALLSLGTSDGHAALNLTPERQKQKTLQALVAWLLEEAERTPLRFSMEDLHWADPSTLEFLKLLIDHAVDARVFILLTHRPEFVPPWGSRSYQSQLTLARLARTQVEEMVGRVSGGKPLPDEIVDQIVSKTDGVPLLVEELTKTMMESGWLHEVQGRYELTGSLPPPAIPATLQDWLMARLDQLAPFREVAQLGATIGREFSEELIRAVSPLDTAALERALAGLVGAELLYRRGPLGQVRYVFKHALIQDAAYESLLKTTRQQFHERIATALETSFSEIAGTQPELLAHHFTAASRIDQAIPWWQKAGDRAAAGGAHAEAVRHYSTALDLLMQGPHDDARDRRELTLRVALALSLASTRGYSAEAVEQVYNRAYELCQSLGESAELFPVLRGLCTFYIVSDQQPKARQLAEQCLRIAQESQRVDYLIEGYDPLGYVLTYQGELKRAREFLSKGIDLYEAHRHEALTFVTPQDPGVACLGLLGVVEWLLGYPDQGLRRAYDALALARELNHPFNLAYAYNYTTAAHSLRGELDKMVEHAQAAFDISSANGIDVWRIGAKLHLVMAKAATGEIEAAIAEVPEVLAAWRECGAELARPLWLINFADLCRLVGKFDQARAAIEEAMEHVTRSGEHEWDALLYRARGNLLNATGGNRAEVEDDFRRGIAVAREQQAKSLELMVAVSLCQLLIAQGRGEEAKQLLHPLYAWFSEGLDTAPLRRAKALLDKLS